MQKPTIKKLKNGLRVLFLPLPQSTSVTVAVFVRAGSAYEDKHNNGISHFLEHMCFKGTDTFPRPVDISNELEQIGASYNAFTERDLTGYYAKVAPRYFSRAFEVISDLYLHPHIEEQEMEKEKGVIIEEIHMYDDDPQSKVSETLESGLYGDQPAGWNIAGTPKLITNTTRDMFINYRAQRYTPSNTVVVIAGAYNQTQALQAIENKFANTPWARKTTAAPGLIKNRKGNAISIVQRELDQTHFAMGFYGLPLDSSRQFEVSMLAKILGGGMSSRLFQRVREDLGAAYYVGSSSITHATHGYIHISAGTNHQKTTQAIEAIIKELRSITRAGVTKEELRRAKDHAIGTFLLSLETSSDLAFYYGQQATIKRVMQSPQEVIRKVKQVTADQVHAAAKEFFKLNQMRFAIIGPYKKNEERRFKKLLQGNSFKS